MCPKKNGDSKDGVLIDPTDFEEEKQMKILLSLRSEDKKEYDFWSIRIDEKEGKISDGGKVHWLNDKITGDLVSEKHEIN